VSFVNPYTMWLETRHPLPVKTAVEGLQGLSLGPTPVSSRTPSRTDSEGLPPLPIARPASSLAHPSPLKFAPGLVREDVSAIEPPRRSKSHSPSLFQFEVPGSVALRPPKSSATLLGVSSSSILRRDDKKRHGSFKIWHRNASEELQEAYNAIYGLPLYGSVVFIGRVPAPEEKSSDSDRDESEFHVRSARRIPGAVTRIVKRFEGSAHYACELGPGIRVDLGSAGKDDGDFSSILINGVEKCENRRGINVVILEPDGRFSSSTAFDTHGLPEESEKLVEVLKALKPDYWVLGAVRDDGTKFLGEAGRDALLEIGIEIPQCDDASRLVRVVDELPVDRTKVLMTVCAKANARKCIRVLLEHGWDIHTRASHTLNTPLHDAIYQRNMDAAIVLLDAGADPTLENKWGETPADIARKKFGFESLEDMIMQSDNHIQSVMRFIGMDY